MKLRVMATFVPEVKRYSEPCQNLYDRANKLLITYSLCSKIYGSEVKLSYG